MRCLTCNFCVDEAFLHFSGHFLPVLNRDSFTVLVSGRYIESSQTDEWSQSSKNSLKSWVQCYLKDPRPSYLLFRIGAFVNEKILTGLLWDSHTNKLSFREKERTPSAWLVCLAMASQSMGWGRYSVTTWEELKYHSLAESRYFLNGQRKKPSHEFMEWNPAKIL